jgi:hypothetical protein
MSNLNALSLSALVARFNECAPKDKQVKKFRDKATAVKRVTEMCGKKASASTRAAKQSSEKAEKLSMAEFHAQRVAAKRNLTITVLVEGNPKKGTAAKRYDLYRDGMTVGEYIKKGGQLRDVTWDAKQGWISVA